MRLTNANKQNTPLVTELVGPAGAGKTTLSRALTRRDASVMVAADLELGKKEHVPIFLINAIQLLPLVLHRCPSSRWFTRDEIKAMVYLKAWPKVLRQLAASGDAAVILDHGPVFKLATLDEFGPDWIKSRRFDRWWTDMFERWADSLDMVIWLDAPDRDLLNRIDGRRQRHAVKGKSQQEVSRYLSRYRASYERVLAKLTARGGPTVVRFDTSHTSTEQMVDELLCAGNLEPQGILRPVS
jgi:shikimate kinase